MRVNKAIVIIAALAVLVFGLGATEDSVKIGMVDLDQAVMTTIRGKAARDEFERRVREAEARIIPLRESFEAAAKELEAKRFILSEEALYQKQLDVQELRLQIENTQKEIQGQLEVARERLLAPLRKELVEIIEEVGREGNFTLIFLRSTPGIMYSREALDATDLVTEKFNKKG
jgi:outer membrane protein